MRPNDCGNHIGRPVARNTRALPTIAQKYIFWPPLKNPTSSASTFSTFVTYALMRLTHRESADVQDIGAIQLSSCSAKNNTKPRLNHGCSSRVVGPPPKIGVSTRKSHGV